jgi:hypothetical protein
MDYSVFKGLQFLLFFGVALGFGWWQLRACRPDPATEEHESPSQHSEP